MKKKNRLHLGKCKATSNFSFPKLYLVNQHTLLRCICGIVFSSSPLFKNILPTRKAEFTATKETPHTSSTIPVYELEGMKIMTDILTDNYRN